MNLARSLKHLMTPHWLSRRAFSAESLAAIEAAVADAEKSCRGELRFVVEPLIVEYQYPPAVHPIVDRLDLFGGQRTREVDTGNLGGKLRRKRAERHCHGRTLPTREYTPQPARFANPRVLSPDAVVHEPFDQPQCPHRRR